MNQGVEILLARMDSNPEEFFEGVKWEWVMRDVHKRIYKDRIDLEDGRVRLPFLSDEEVKALYDKMESLRAEQFTHKVMSTLLEESEVNPFADAVMQGFGAALIKAEGAAILYNSTKMKTKGRYNI